MRREWLAKHHDSESEVWLVSHKRQAGRPSIAYDDAVDGRCSCSAGSIAWSNASMTIGTPESSRRENPIADGLPPTASGLRSFFLTDASHRLG